MQTTILVRTPTQPVYYVPNWKMKEIACTNLFQWIHMHLEWRLRVSVRKRQASERWVQHASNDSQNFRIFESVRRKWLVLEDLTGIPSNKSLFLVSNDLQVSKLCFTHNNGRDCLFCMFRVGLCGYQRGRHKNDTLYALQHFWPRDFISPAKFEIIVSLVATGITRSSIPWYF